MRARRLIRGLALLGMAAGLLAFLRRMRSGHASTSIQGAEPVGGPGSVRTRTPLRGIAEIRRFFRTNETPIYFVSATPFNLLGMDRFVRNFRFINYYDSFDGAHPNVFVPREREPRAFESIEEIVNYLLGHKEVADLVRAGGRGRAVFLMFDEETEQLAKELDLEVAFPPATLRHHLDSKLITTRLGNEAGVPSVPNVLGRADDYGELRSLAQTADLGTDLVVQLSHGDSGQTTFFLGSEGEWAKHGEDLRGRELKVMRRIEPRETAIEGVITGSGTIVGPLMTELTGFPEMTPYGGGWCGNEVFATVLSEQQRKTARAGMRRMGDRLRREGYTGYFEIDFLADAATGEMYLGELNPRVTGASSMTNVSAVAYCDVPLFLFHLLEFMEVEYELDVEELNDRWCAAENLDSWSQLVFKETDDVVELITAAPPSGVWRMDGDGAVGFLRRETDWHHLSDEGEAFYLRIAGPGQYRYKGADLGILVARGRMMDDAYELNDRALAWIRGIKAHLVGIPVDEETAPPHPDPFGFKML